MKRIAAFILLVFLLQCSVFAVVVGQCNKCGEYVAFSTTVLLQPTCTSSGKTGCVCPICGNTFAKDYIPMISHSYVISSISASCENSGSSVTKCSMCGLVSSSEEISALGHSYSPTTISEATCTTDGLIRYTCDRSGCGKSYDSVIPALGHLLSSETVEATCIAEGSKVTTCSRCDYSEIETVAALGHALTTTVTDATCVSDGSKVSVCSRCDYSATETIAMFGHDWQETQRIEPTYESDGKIVTTCSRCQEITTETIPALDVDSCTHVWVEIKRVEPTFSTSGKVDYECSSCGSTMMEILPVLDSSSCIHQYEEKSRVEATFEEDGLITYECIACGTSKVVRIPMLTIDEEDGSILTDLKIAFSSIFGLYEPIMTTHVTTTSSSTEVTQVLTTGVAEGAAGVDYEYLAGVFLFSILFYCVLRLFGGVMKQWRT